MFSFTNAMCHVIDPLQCTSEIYTFGCKKEQATLRISFSFMACLRSIVSLRVLDCNMFISISNSLCLEISASFFISELPVKSHKQRVSHYHALLVWLILHFTINNMAGFHEVQFFKLRSHSLTHSFLDQISLFGSFVTITSIDIA